ncbi:MAG: radical SAM protein, partial [Saprospiraceae bacterium]|nr:radical SAM protein [Saprospiraceae bacterium]
MSSVLITNTYFYPLDRKQWREGQPYPPYGTLSAAAMLENDYQVIFYDNSLESSTRALVKRMDVTKPDYLVIYDDGFNYLTKMCLTVMRKAAFEMITAANKVKVPVLISSSDSTDHFDLYLSHGADFVLLGEGEITLLETLQKLQSNTSVREVKGLVWRSNGDIIRNEPRGVLIDLDGLPDPAWHLVDLAPYRKIWQGLHGYFSLNLATTRGCPFKCNWCAKPIYGNRYNVRSPERVVAEIRYLQETVQVKHFWFCDDIF